MNIHNPLETASRYQRSARGVFPTFCVLLFVIGCSIQTAHAEEAHSLGPVHTWGTEVMGLGAIPGEIEFEHVKTVSAGGNFSLALTEDGQVFVWGAEDLYSAALLILPESLSGKRVVSIAAGDRHALALTDDGVVHGWGNPSTSGRLPVPELPDWLQSGVQAVSAGIAHSLALAADTGRLWSWGSLAAGSPVSEMPTEGGFKAIASGGYHCLAVTEDGRVVAWGTNDRGQTDVPEELTDGTHRVKKIAAGLYHSLAVTEDGQLWGWGYDQYEEASKYYQHYGYKDVAAGNQFSVALTLHDAVLAWGFNYHDQAEPPEKLGDRHHPDFVPVIAISAGWRHALAATMSAKVATPVISTEPFATQVNVTLSCETQGATIYYTLDGSDPTIGDGTPYGGGFPIAVIEPATIKARAFKEGYFDSEIAEEELFFLGRAITVGDADFGSVAIGETQTGKIKIRNRGQLQAAIVAVLIDSDDEGVFEVFFSSMVMLDPGEEIQVNVSFSPDRIGLFEGAITVHPGSDTRILSADPEATGTGIPPPPTGFRESGNYLNQVSMELESYTGTTVRYRIFTDEWSSWEPYDSDNEVVIEDLGTTRLEAKAVAGGVESEVVEKTYVIFRVTTDQSLDFGEVKVGTIASKTITLSSEGGVDLSLKSVSYLDSGSDEIGVIRDEETWPMELVSGGSVDLTVFFEPDSVGEVSGRARISFGLFSTSILNLPITGTGIPAPQLARPTIQPDAEDGPFYWSVPVKILTATEGAVIRYTLDGSDPGAASTLYDGEPFNLDTRGVVTVKSRAFKSGWSASEVAVAEYTIVKITVGTATAVVGADGHLGLTVDEEGEGQLVGFIGSAEAVFAFEVRITGLGKIIVTGKLISHADLARVGNPASVGAGDRPVAADDAQPEVIGAVGSDGTLTFDIPGIGEFTGEVDPMTGSAAGMAGGYEIDLLYGDSGTCYAVVGSDGTVTLVIETPDGVEGCHGILDSSGHVVMTSSQSGVADLKIGADHSMTLMLTPEGSTETSEFAGLAAGVAASNRLVNLSTRGFVGTQSQNMIAGFVINGIGRKPVLIRAMGPALAGDPFNVPGTIEDPRIELIPLGSTTAIAENDNWSDIQDVQSLLDAISVTGAFPATSGSRDAMILAELDPGSYTAKISGISGGTGVVIVEVYTVEDLDTPDARQVNISTRGFIGTGGSIMILGLKADGNTPRQFLIRAVGPTLGIPPFNISGVLSDPVLTVVRSSDGTEVATNDDWDEGASGDTIHAMFSTLGAFELPRGSKDAVVLITLPTTSSFTVKISGKDGETGVAIAEVYEVQ